MSTKAPKAIPTVEGAVDDLDAIIDSLAVQRERIRQAHKIESVRAEARDVFKDATAALSKLNSTLVRVAKAQQPPRPAKPRPEPGSPQDSIERVAAERKKRRS